MDTQTFLIVVSVLGAVIGALSHGLQLLDRSRRWVAGRRRRDAGVENQESAGDQPPLASRRRLGLWLGGSLLLLAFAIVAVTAIWRGGGDATRTTSAAIPGAIPLPSTPAIAILPFNNLSEEATQALLAEGLTENLTSTLETIAGLLVVAQRSVLGYKDRSVPVQQVGREQGVRHVLTGGVQRVGARLRVTTQLTDAGSGRQV